MAFQFDQFDLAEPEYQLWLTFFILRNYNCWMKLERMSYFTKDGAGPLSVLIF